MSQKCERGGTNSIKTINNKKNIKEKRDGRVVVNGETERVGDAADQT
jgi:hypothetical protein